MLEILPKDWGLNPCGHKPWPRLMGSPDPAGSMLRIHWCWGSRKVDHMCNTGSSTGERWELPWRGKQVSYWRSSDVGKDKPQLCELRLLSLWPRTWAGWIPYMRHFWQPTGLNSKQSSGRPWPALSTEGSLLHPIHFLLQFKSSWELMGDRWVEV